MQTCGLQLEELKKSVLRTYIFSARNAVRRIRFHCAEGQQCETVLDKSLAKLLVREGNEISSTKSWTNNDAICIRAQQAVSSWPCWWYAADPGARSFGGLPIASPTGALATAPYFSDIELMLGSLRYTSCPPSFQRLQKAECPSPLLGHQIVTGLCHSSKYREESAR
jgi:hypothetical protein